jgi:predicted dinucleotide-binding enzyme
MAHAPSQGLRRREVLRCLAAAAAAAAPLFAGPRAASAQTSDPASLKIGMIGAGRHGGALGTLFAQHGHPVMFSSRNPEQLGDLVAKAGPNARAGTVAQAVAFGDVIIIAVPYTAMEQIAVDHGKALAAKPLVIDVSNPIPRRDGEDFVRRIAEQGGPGLVGQKLLPGVRLVRAFNAIGSARLAPLSQKRGETGVPIAGDDRDAVQLASALIHGIGFEPVHVGGLAMGKYLVPGTPLGGEQSPADLRRTAATLN